VESDGATADGEAEDRSAPVTAMSTHGHSSAVRSSLMQIQVFVVLTAAALVACGEIAAVRGSSSDGGADRSPPRDAGSPDRVDSDRVIRFPEPDAEVGASDADSLPECAITCPCDACGVSPSAEPTLLASAQTLPSVLVVDGTDVYWRNLGHDTTTFAKSPMPYVDGGIMKCAIAGCNEEPAPFATGLSAFGDFALAIGGGNVYWTALQGGNADHIWECAASGCSGRPTDLTAGAAATIAADDQSIYWITADGTSVMECPSVGCGDGAAPVQLWSGQANQLTYAMAVDDADVYWLTAQGEVFQCAKGGCNGQPAMIASSHLPESRSTMAVDADNVYWTTALPLSMGELFACPKTGCGSSPTPLATGLTNADVVATDGVNVYWADAIAQVGQNACDVPTGYDCAWRVAECAVTGCGNQPTTLAVPSSPVAAIAVDAENVYWATSGASATDGTIWKLGK
jgi:hypothetical protein